mgnify:CR=1 FL=1
MNQNRFVANNGESLRDAAINGLGIVGLPEFIINRYRKITGGWQKDTPPENNPMYGMKHSTLMRISMPILSTMGKLAYARTKSEKKRANRGGGKKIKLKKNSFGEYNFKNINDGWTLLKKKTRKRKRKRKKRGKKKRSIKKYKY